MVSPEREETDRRREAFRRAMIEARENPSSLERKSGVARSTIVSYLSGKTASLKGINEQKIAAALGLTIDALYGGVTPTPPDRLPVILAGSIGRGLAVANYYAAVASHSEAHEIVIPAIEAEAGFLYFEIAAEGAPFGPPGWILRVVEMRQPPEELLGYPVIAELADGTRWLGQLRKWGDRAGRFSLYRWGVGEPIDNVTVTSAHRVVGSFDRNT